ncbi:non-specific lipid-transfer protein 3-like [Vigna umbellata]|uniref:non-specific lipid-transfer protein 3-like n=1 Tax=Vigna umbellata TaxID=87088 RepID=UPI001F5E52EB|nr:non-specific lipid-transfer protein 3-like [Vigna umbellata]
MTFGPVLKTVQSQLSLKVLCLLTMKMSRAAIVSIVILLITGCEAQGSIKCPTVIEDVTPCVSFLKSNTKHPSDECCQGIKSLNGEAGSHENREAICLCLKQGLAAIGDYDPQRIPLVPKECGLSVTLPPIDDKTDCKKAIFIM